MKKIGAVLVFALFSMIFPLHGFAYTIGDINNDNKIDMTEAIHALQVASSVRTATASATINVPSQVPTIQQAINAAAPGDIINVAAGAYTETLTIKNKALTIQGAGSGATTITGFSGANTLTIDGAKVVIISKVTIQQGNYGILAERGAVIEVSDTVVQDTTDRGIRIMENSTARLTNVTVLRSGVDGISAIFSSSITFSGTVASNDNLRHGVNIVDSSSAFFYGATVTVNANGYHGINVINNSGLIVDSSSITIKDGLGNTSNNGRGIQAFGSSSIHLQNGSSLLSENNGMDGIGVGSASSFYTDATSSLTVRLAKRHGIVIFSDSSLLLSGTALVENNAANGAQVVMSSNLLIQGTASLTIQNNVNIGLSLYQGTVHVDPTAMLTVRGSTGQGIGINLGNKSALGVNGGLLVQNNTGNGINIQNGSQVTLYPTSLKTVVVQNNGYGIRLWDGSGVSGGVSGGGTITITPNTTRDLDISFGSRASLPTSSYGTSSCTGSSVTTMVISCSP